MIPENFISIFRNMSLSRQKFAVLLLAYILDMNKCVILMYGLGLRGRSLHTASLPTNPVITGHYCLFHLVILLGALITT